VYGCFCSFGGSGFIIGGPHGRSQIKNKNKRSTRAEVKELLELWGNERTIMRFSQMNLVFFVAFVKFLLLGSFATPQA